jgi:hypothetical protein
MRTLALIIISALLSSTGLLSTSCSREGNGIYARERAGYPYSGRNAKKRSYAEKKYMRPR